MERDGMERTPRIGSFGGRRAGLRRPGTRGTAALLAALAVTGCASLPPVASAPPPEPPPVPLVLEPDPPLLTRVAEAKGWGWLVEKLVADGLDRARVAGAFADPAMPAFDGLFFRIDPAEPRSLYQHLRTARSVGSARACRAENADAFESAERATGVSADVVAAILHVETHCGENTGSSLVLYGLARLAMANEPGNVEANVARSATTDDVVDEDLAARVRARAGRLEEIFYPEVRATFPVSERLGLGPLDLTGSPSGAFGYPQFLPTSFERFGRDGNGDGRVDLYDLYDAAASAASFLAGNGWRPGLSRDEQAAVIWNYNRSAAYIETVLDLAGQIAPPPGQNVAGGTLEAGQ